VSLMIVAAMAAWMAFETELAASDRTKTEPLWLFSFSLFEFSDLCQRDSEGRSEPLPNRA
jgi:hypothetical protein